MVRGAVVVAHSEYAVRQPLRDALERAGYDTIGARDADEAIDALRDRMVCLAIVQGDLPDGGARRVHLWLEDGARANVPVAYLTGEDDDPLHHTRHGLSPAFVITLPLDADQVIRTMGDVIGAPGPRTVGDRESASTLLLVEDDDQRFDEVRDLLTWGGDVDIRILGAPTIHEARRILHSGEVDCVLFHAGAERGAPEQLIADLCHTAGNRPVVALLDAPDERLSLRLMRHGCTDVLDLISVRRDRSLTFRIRSATQRARRVRRAILSDAARRSRARHQSQGAAGERAAVTTETGRSRRGSASDSGAPAHRAHPSPLAAGIMGAALCVVGFLGARLSMPQPAGGSVDVSPIAPAAGIAAPSLFTPAQEPGTVESLFASEREFQEYCRHVALATLASQHVESDDNEIRFYKDTTVPGSATEQFAELFGRAIQTRRNPPLKGPGS